jgi:hypothetical protein
LTRQRVLSVFWSVGAWALALVGLVVLLDLLDKFLPPLDRGVLRAGLRGAIGGGWVALVYQTSRAINARARRMRAVGALTEMARDPRPPVLYFRSFEDDKFSYFNFAASFEEILAAVFRDVGPVVAIARPDEHLPPIGAARLAVGSEQWQDVVRRLLASARVVIIRPGLTAGVLWEVNATLQHVAPERVLIALPRSERSKESATDREARYARFRDVVKTAVPVPLPETLGDAVFIAFDAHWVPQPLGSVSDESRTMFWPRGGVRTALRPFFERLGVSMPKRRWEVAPALVGLALSVSVGKVILNAGPTWTPYAPAGARMTVSLPGPTEEQRETLSSPAGPVAVLIARASWRRATYTVAYADYPEAIVAAQSTDQLLDRGRDGEVASTKGTLLRETPITVEGVPGRDLVIAMKKEKMLAKVRALLVGRQLVQMTALLPDDEEYPFKNSSDVETFFGSVHLTPRDR